MAVFAYAYGRDAYGQGRYGGDHPVVLIPSVVTTGLPFIVANDRNSVVVCSDTGNASSGPTFRYWFAAPAPIGEALTGDTALPQYYSTDEHGLAPVGSLEFPFKTSKIAQEWNIDGVVVEFTPHPRSVEPGIGSLTFGFTVHVEGYGQVDFAKSDGSHTSGVKVSGALSFSDDLQNGSSSPWPNTRTAYFPIRMNRVRAARPIISANTLCEINVVQLIGKAIPIEQT